MVYCVLVSLLLFTVSFMSCVSGEKPPVVTIGAVLAYDSVIGAVAKVAIEAAVEDVNADTQVLPQTRSNMIMHDSGCSPFLGAVKVLQALEHDAVAIIGPQSSVEAHMISSISTGLQIPFISFAATDPTLSSLQFPFFIRTAQTDVYQMSAMADLIDHFGWRRVIAVFTDDDYGRNGINFLADELTKKLSMVYKMTLPIKPNRAKIEHLLRMSKTIGPRVYVVHVTPDSGLDIFSVAQQLNMMSEGYVWLATDWLSTYLDTFAYFSSLTNLQGVVGFRQHIPHSNLKDTFLSRWSKLQNKGVVKSNLNAYSFYAYDAVWALAHAINDFLKNSGNLTFSINNEVLTVEGRSNLKMLKFFDGGPLLFNNFFSLNFTGLSSQVQFDSDRNRKSSNYEIINIDGKVLRNVGYWSYNSGLSTTLPESFYVNRKGELRNNHSLGIVTWPGGSTETPKGWVVASDERPLKIGVPYRVSFIEFVTVSEKGIKADVSGYCIDVFRAATKLIKYDVPFEFVPVGDGRYNPNYDRFVKMVSDEVIDGAIGDIAIVPNRSRTVDFTQPYISTGLVILAPIKMESNASFFYRPFTDGMWGMTAGFFLLIAFVIWLFEDRVNNAFQGPPRQQCIRAILFSLSTLFKSQREPTLSTFGRFVMVIWLFLLLVVTSSYTASVTSFLTVQQLASPIKDIDTLVASNEPIGYQVGSFAKSYLEDSYNVQRSRLVALGSPEAYKEALERGPKSGGVAAIVDELPYVQLFLEQTKGFGIIGHQFTSRGWGFVCDSVQEYKFMQHLSFVD